MTSLYLSLTGTYAQKIPYYRWESPHAFPKKKLYLNLLSPSEDLELEYDFKFLTEDEAKSACSDFWFECGKILDITDQSKVSMFLMQNDLMNTALYTKEQSESQKLYLMPETFAVRSVPLLSSLAIALIVPD